MVPAPAVPETPMLPPKVIPPAPAVCCMSRLVSGVPTPILPVMLVIAVPERISKA